MALGALVASLPSIAMAKAPADSGAVNEPQASTSEPAKAPAGEGNDVGEIVVTALKRAERVQNIPASISAVSGEMLAQRGIADIRALTSAIPNLVVGEFVGSTLITIRGVGSNVDSGLTEPTVAVYADGLALPRATMARLRAVDLERVEVLRGPQGTLYGRNATGGAVNFISARPSKELTGKVEVSTGSRDALGINGFVSGPLADGVYVRVSGGREKQDGIVKVLNTGQTLGGVDAKYGRVAFLLEPSSDIAVDLGLRYERDNAPVGYQQSINANRFEIANGPSVATHEPYKLISNNRLAGFKETLIVSGGINWQLSDALSLKYLGGYIDHDSYDFYDPDGSSVAFSHVEYDRASKSISQELTLIGDYEGFKFILGAYFFKEKANNIFLTTFESAHPSFPGSLRFGARARITNMALYGDIKYSVTSRFGLNLGLRLNHEDNDFNQFFATASTDQTVKATRLLPKVAATYEFSPDVNGYAQWSRGYKSGGGQFGQGSGVQPPYRPEVLDAFEVGLKSQFADRRVTANLAAFYYKYTDLQFLNFIPEFTTRIDNSDARLFGVEADFRFEATDHTTLSLAPTWLDGKFKDRVVVEPVTGIPYNLDGNRLPRAPKFTVSAGIEQRFDLGGDLFSELQLNGNVKYSSTTVLRFFDLNEFERQTGYALIDLSASVMDADRKTRLAAFVNNLTDKAVQISSFRTANGYYGNYGAPRTWGVRLSRQF
ncbi:TonB-dependent receptor [Novosphingobium colocasiae]|uniref:TonB-dependent receptor n=2 Tax=Novosphingobium colocasiae TaxID=1256513 RepID=A0A918UL16_9SPHN|nr:TonB-dependent receptor [Novosphingobium colocasiae]